MNTTPAGRAFKSLCTAISLPLLAISLGSSIAFGNEDILKMKPTGYWPLNEGKGEVIRDLSPNANHGAVHHVPWAEKGDYLNFTGAYQWLEIPAHEAYQTKAYSFGGWFFMRDEVIGSGWPNKQGFLLLGNRHWLNGAGVQLCVRKQEVIDVVSDGEEDVMKTRLFKRNHGGKRVDRAFGKPNLGIGKWHHLIYSFEPGKQKSNEPKSENLALSATVTASNSGGHSARKPQNAVDGNADSAWIIWPGAGPKSDSERWIQLDFNEEVEVNRIRLTDRQVSSDMFLRSVLHFSDGSSITVDKFTGEWDGMFAAKKVKWIRFEGIFSNGSRPGLKEFEVYREDITIYQEEGVVANVRKRGASKGTGKLYLNGELIASKVGVSSKPANASLQIGNDAYWWHQLLYSSGSLNGSVKDMVWFNRAMAPSEAKKLHDASKPKDAPEVHAKGHIVLDGYAIYPEDLPGLSDKRLCAALVLLEEKDAGELMPFAKQLAPALSKALGTPGCRSSAVKMLLKIGQKAVALQAVDGLLALVQDASKLEKERADSALALAGLGSAAAKALRGLCNALNATLPEAGLQAPKIEEILRNALTFALLEIDPESSEAKQALKRAFCEPMMRGFIPKGEALADDAQLKGYLEKSDYSNAVKYCNRLPKNQKERYFSHKAGKDRDYTGTAYYKGGTYKVGEGVAWKGVEKVSAKEYRDICKRLSGDYPSVGKWRPVDYEHLYRVPITKIDKKGNKQVVYLESKDFVLDGEDAKCRAWSIFVDKMGHIHLMGGQHNIPNPGQYIPGSWEKMGVSRDKKGETFPLQMYWVSKKPECIDSFEFVGQGNNPRAIPASYLNYMVLEQSPSNETFLYGRSNAFGWQCWGMFSYSAKDKRWTSIGGDPYGIIKTAQKADPFWSERLHDPVRGNVPSQPSGIRRLVWAWQPAFYNFCRDGWGIRFDRTGRMHLLMNISGLDGTGYVRHSSVFAYSDDKGKTFHRADGSNVELPLTINPSPEHNAEIAMDNTLQKHCGGQFEARKWRDLWMELIKRAGFQI